MKIIVRIIIILITLKHFTQSVDYKIISDQIPSYLKYTSLGLNNTIIPIDLKFNVSLSAILGTLLYAIDSENNQLILTLYNNVKERIHIEFRGHAEYVHLETLCGCHQCKYQWLSLNVKIEKDIQMKCNNKDVIKLKYKDEKKVKKDYPEKSKQLVIYFINTPEHSHGFPNNDQLEGCFKDAFLNGKSMHLEPFPKDLPKCKSSCADNVCNGGKCYDTFSDNAICDCSATFLNGPNCNSDLHKGSLKSNSSQMNQKFNFIKLTWISNSYKVLSFDYGKFEFSILNENGSILVEYKEKKPFLQSLKGTLVNNYKEFTKCTLFFSFKTKLVHLEFNTSNVNVSGEFAVPLNIGEESIKSCRLLDDEDDSGKIDIVYKNHPSDFRWIPVPYKDGKNPQPENKTTTEPPVIKNADFPWTVLFISLEILAINGSIILWIFLLKRGKLPINRKVDSKVAEPLLDHLENREII